MIDPNSSKAIHPDQHPEKAQLKRRGMLMGAGAVGLGAVAVKGLSVSAPSAASVAAAMPKVVEPSSGYQLTAHVLRYYETTRS